MKCENVSYLIIVFQIYPPKLGKLQCCQVSLPMTPKQGHLMIRTKGVAVDLASKK
jgi:hypothetical protein